MDERLVVEDEFVLITYSGFERLIRNLVGKLPGWTAQLQGKATTPDGGVDVHATSPSGMTYVIQAKFWADKIGPDQVDKTFAAKYIRHANVGIIVAKLPSIENAFTKSAIDRAKELGIVLWSANELQVLADFSLADARNMLIELGLDPTPASPTPTPAALPVAVTSASQVETPPPFTSRLPPPPRRPRVAWAWPFLAALALTVGWVGRDSYTAITNNSDAKAVAVEKLIRSYEAAYRDDLNYGRARSSGTYMDALLYEDFSAILDARVNQNCNLATDELSPTQINRIEWLGNELARVQAMRHWKQQLTCANGTSRVLVNGFVEIEYTVSLVDIDGKKRWIVVNASRI